MSQDTSQLSPVDARNFLLHIFRHSPDVYRVLSTEKLPATVDYYYYDRIQDILAANLSRFTIGEQQRLLRWISATHKAYPHNPEYALFIGVLGLPSIYSRNIYSNIHLYYPTDTDDAAVNETNARLLDHIRRIRTEPDRYRHQLVLMADRYNEEHQYTENNLRDILLEDYTNSYSYSMMKRIENSYTVMTTISRCLGNSNSLIPHNVMLYGHVLGEEQGLNSVVYLMDYNSRVPTVMKTITEQVSRTARTNPLDQLHEYLVGVKVNELRTEIANFVYTYGYSRVTNPVNILDTAVDMLGLFNSDNHAQLYIQYIENASPIYYLSQASRMQVIDSSNKELSLTLSNGLVDAVNIQILCALLYAYQKLRFKHNDLNGGNILIVGLSEMTAVPIKVPVSYDRQTDTITFVTRYMYTDRLVMVIDYGRASVNFDYTTEIYNAPLLPLFSAFDAYEGTGIERDVLFYLMQIIETVTYRELETEDDYTNTKYGLLNLVYSIVTGRQLTTYTDTLYNRVRDIFMMIGSGHLMTYPGEQYHLVDALIRYCDTHSSLLHDSTGSYKSILSDPVFSQSTDLRIDSVPKYYMYRYMPDSNAEIVPEEILNNREYRRRIAFAPFSMSNDDDDYIDLLWLMQNYKHSNFVYRTLGQIPSYQPTFVGVEHPLEFLPIEPYVSPINQLANSVVICRQVLNA